jgi:hypothetical protein
MMQLLSGCVVFVFDGRQGAGVGVIRNHSLSLQSLFVVSEPCGFGDSVSCPRRNQFAPNVPWTLYALEPIVNGRRANADRSRTGSVSQSVSFQEVSKQTRAINHERINS